MNQLHGEEIEMSLKSCNQQITAFMKDNGIANISREDIIRGYDIIYDYIDPSFPEQDYDIFIQHHSKLLRFAYLIGSAEYNLEKIRALHESNAILSGKSISKSSDIWSTLQSIVGGDYENVYKHDPGLYDSEIEEVNTKISNYISEKHINLLLSTRYEQLFGREPQKLTKKLRYYNLYDIATASYQVLKSIDNFSIIIHGKSVEESHVYWTGLNKLIKDISYDAILQRYIQYSSKVEK
jgi:hypothetical protein